MDSCRIHHHADSRLPLNIGRPLPVIYPCSLLLKTLRQGRLMGIGAGYGKSLIQKYFCQAAHADASDSDKVYMFWFIKIYLIHNQ